MNKLRIIPRLDIKGPNLVKGIHLEGLRVLGQPEAFARHYYQEGADELIYMDVVASLYGRNSLHEIIQRTASEIFIPLTVGGGLRSVEDIRDVLRAGADKVSLNTAVIQRPELIREAAQKFGSSTIVVSIEAIRKPDGTYEAFTDNGREATGVNACEWAVRAAQLGAGEVFITSINQEGTGEGFDLELTRRIADSVSVPVIACGGAGASDHILSVLKAGHVNGVALASILHYHLVKHAELLEEDRMREEGNVEFIRSQRSFSKIQDISIPQLKKYLTECGIECRAPRQKVFHETSC